MLAVSTLLASVITVVLDVITNVNDWFGIEIELMLPVMVLVALADMAAELFKLKKNTADRVLLVAAFVVGSLVQYLFGDYETTKEGLKAALYLGSISVAIHFGVRDYLLSFFLETVPMVFGAARKAMRKKVAILFGVNMEKELLDEAPEEDENVE